MKPKVLILGGGMAGISCARELYSQAREDLDFAMITEQLGGNAAFGPGNVSYGAYYVQDFYDQVKPLTTNLQNVRAWEGQVVEVGDRRIDLFSCLFSREFFDLMRFKKHLKGFLELYIEYKKRAGVVGQCAALEESRVLAGLHTIDAQSWWDSQFSGGKHLKSLIAGIAKGFTFSSLDQISALELLKYTLNIILPTFKFELNVSNLTADFDGKVHIANIIRAIRRPDGRYLVETSSGDFAADYLVLALGAANDSFIASNGLGKSNVQNIGQQAFGRDVGVTMYHLRGVARDDFSRGKYFGFTDSMSHNICSISKEVDGTFLFYMREDRQEDLKTFFKSFQVIHRKHWPVAFRMGKRTEFKSEFIGKNIYQAGPLNIESLEDAYTSGQFVAAMVRAEIRAQISGQSVSIELKSA